MKGDLVFFESNDETLIYLMVVTDTSLVDTNIRVYVKAVSGNDNIISVSINKLLSDKGLIVVIPSYLYSIENDCALFTDIAQVLFQETTDRNSKLSYSDDDWALLQSNFTCDQSVLKESSEQSVSILTSAECTNKRKPLDCPSKSVYISLQPAPTSPHAEHKLRRLRGLS